MNSKTIAPAISKGYTERSCTCSTGGPEQRHEHTEGYASLFVAWATAAWASDCPRPGMLGTSRILEVDAAKYPRVGLRSFPQALPLDDKEVVLTFNDGPAATTADSAARKGIIDTRAQTSAMLPDFLKYMRVNGYRVVHVVPKPKGPKT